MSAGRLYDKIGGKAKGKIVFVTDGGVICKVISNGKDKPVMIEEDKVKDENLQKACMTQVLCDKIISRTLRRYI